MIALDFGNCAFNGNLENYIMLVIAPKREFDSMDAFVDRAIVFLNSDSQSDFCDDYATVYSERIYKPCECGIDADFRQMSKRVGFQHEPILHSYLLIEPKWNDMTYILETETEYILYNWGTAA